MPRITSPRNASARYKGASVIAETMAAAPTRLDNTIRARSITRAATIAPATPPTRNQISKFCAWEDRGAGHHAQVAHGVEARQGEADALGDDGHDRAEGSQPDSGQNLEPHGLGGEDDFRDFHAQQKAGDGHKDPEQAASKQEDDAPEKECWR